MTAFEPDAFEGLSVELRDDGVGVVLFNRPEKFNALTTTTLGVLTRAFRALGEREDCGAIVFSGVGPAFCAGMDLTDANPAAPDRDPVHVAFSAMRDAVSCALAMREIPQPVIAAVSGPAVGGGFALAAAADIRICAPDAAFMAPFVKLGVTIGDMGLSWLLPRLIGAGAAAEVFYTGGTIGAQDGLRLGLVQHVVDDPVQSSITMAAKIAAQPRLGVQMSKQLLNASIGAGGLREHLETEMRSQVISLMTEDHRAALRAFASRRGGTA
ncbi:MAG: enoyl-CoA hydratase/isomerase family protein [Mycobacterium sp.]|nr:MAG: enoyl-CoA hydratase/isomerase family protein [Mycobacterium sp.]